MSRAALEGAIGGAVVRAVLALPGPLLRLLGGRRRPEASGLEPDAWLLAKLGTAARERRGAEALPPTEARERFAVETAMIVRPPDVAVDVSPWTVAGRDALLFVPDG